MLDDLFSDDSWRGPDTQRGRYVPYLEKNCGGAKGLGMEPADFELVADGCAMGHLPCMRRLQRHFEARISPQARERLDRYLGEGTDTRQEWDAWLEARRDDCFNVRAHAFWLCRLAQFGDEGAKAVLEKRPGLETVAFIKYHPVKSRYRNAVTMYGPGEAGAARLGLLDLAKAKGTLPFWDVEEGIARAEEYAGDSGFDETGFGMAEEYDLYYFDEYYRLLNALYGWSNHDVRVNKERILAVCREKRAAFRAEREAFMRLYTGVDTIPE